MASVNREMLLGNLGSDPTLRYLPDGSANPKHLFLQGVRMTLSWD